MAKSRKLTDDDLLRLVRSEKQRSIGFSNDEILTSERIRALDYAKGRMVDVPALDNRSRVVSSDVADALATIMPDLVEMFTTGDDDFAFQPNGPQDEEQAQQETDYVNQVVFRDNDGFMLLTTMLQDALLTKTGVAEACWIDAATETEEFEGKTLQEAIAAMQSGQISDVEVVPDPDTGEQLYNFTLSNEQPGRVKVHVFPPEDFTAAADTVMLRDTTYCAVRTRPRAQQLIADGYKRDLVESLPNFGSDAQEEGTEYARDTVGETNKGINAQGGDEPFELRTVEIIKHVLRVDANGDGKPELHVLVTGNDEVVLLKHEVCDRVYFSAAKPFLVTHRFYGESLADKLFEIQRIKTALMRMWLDSGYFALNQRQEINMGDALPQSIEQLLDNTPGQPVQSKSGNLLKPIESAPLGFEPSMALEYFSTVAEQRTGIVRNAQGLNPDTLHDTASGQQALMTMAQKRVRMIARMLAETGLKDLFLNVHALLRKHSSGPAETRLRGKWVAVDPSAWAERNDMTVEIGMGASGKEMQQAELRTLAPLMQQIIQMQGGKPDPQGYITPQNFFSYLEAIAKSCTLKTVDSFFSDPTQAPPAPPAPPPPPDPAIVKAQADAQAQQAKDARQHEAEGVKLLLEHQKAQAAQQREAEKLAAQEQENQRKFLLESAKLEQQKELEMAKLEQARQLAILELGMKYNTTIDVAQIRAAAEAGRTLADIHTTDMSHQHESEMQEKEHAHAEKIAASAPEADDEPNAGVEDGEA